MVEDHKQSGTQLKPLHFSVESRYRFTVLIVLSITISFALGFSALPAYLPSPENLIPCMSDPMESWLRLDWMSDAQVSESHDATMRLVDCLSLGSGISGIVVPIAFVILHLALTAAIRIASTPRILRRKDVSRVSAEADESHRDTAVHNRLDKVLRQLDCKLRPTLHQGDGKKDDIRCFGTNRNPRILIATKNFEYLVKDPDKFEALLGHECSHIVNGDVSRNQWFWAFWFAYLYGIVPLFLLSIGIEYARNDTSKFVEFISPVVRLVLVSTVLYLAVLSVNRSWERLADFRAGIVEKWRSLLTEMHIQNANEMSARERDLPWAKKVILSIGRRFLLPHPPDEERAEYLRDSNIFFSSQNASVFGYSLALGVCVLPWFAGFLFGGMTAITSENPAPSYLSMFVFFIVLVAASFALVGSIKISVWRSLLLHDLIPTTGRPSIWCPALLAAFGFAVGFAISPYGGAVFVPFGVSLDLLWINPEFSYKILITLFVLFFLLFYALFRWKERFGYAWNGRIARRSWGRSLISPLLFLSSVPFVLLVPVFILLAITVVVLTSLVAGGSPLLHEFARTSLTDLGLNSDISDAGLPFVGMALIVAILLLSNPLTVLAAITVALAPLSAVLIGIKPSPPYKSWILREGQGEDNARIADIRPLITLGAGILGGIVLGTVLLGPIARMLLEVTGIGGPVDPDNLKFFTALTLGAMALMYAFISFTVAAVVPNLRFEHGVSAGLIACLTFTMHWFAQPGESGGTLPAIMIASMFVLSTSLLCPIGALLGAGVGRLITTRSSSTDEAQKDGRPRISWRTALVMLAFGAIATVGIQQMAPEYPLAIASEKEMLPSIEEININSDDLVVRFKIDERDIAAAIEAAKTEGIRKHCFRSRRTAEICVASIGTRTVGSCTGELAPSSRIAGAAAFTTYGATGSAAGTIRPIATRERWVGSKWRNRQEFAWHRR